MKPGAERLDCVSYNPYRTEYTLNENKKQVTKETIDADLAIIAKRFHCVRTYTTLYGMDAVPEIAAKYKLSVILGVWISADLMENMHDLELALDTAKSPAVTHVLIGNEALFFNIVSPKYIYLYLEYAHSRTNKPISTGEIVSTWDQYKKLAELSDFIAIHVFPYWNNVPVESAIDYLQGEYGLMEKLFPDKEIMVAETGWPSNGVDHGPSEATLLNQAIYTREVSKYLSAKNVRYNIIEAFDQPWKIFGTEKHAGGSFGVFDDQGREKFSLSGPLSLYGSSFMVKIIEEFVGSLPGKNILTNMSTIVLLQKLYLNSDIGICTTLLFIVAGLFLGWFGGHLRMRAFVVSSFTILILINIIIMIGYKAWIGHYIYLYQFWVNIPLMLLPVAGILYQLRDYMKIVGR